MTYWFFYHQLIDFCTFVLNMFPQKTFQKKNENDISIKGQRYFSIELSETSLESQWLRIDKFFDKTGRSNWNKWSYTIGQQSMIMDNTYIEWLFIARQQISELIYFYQLTQFFVKIVFQIELWNKSWVTRVLNMRL